MIFKKREDIVARREGDKTMLFDPKTTRLFLLNPTSTFIWDQCTGDQDTGNIARLFEERYEIPDDYSDVEGLVIDHLTILEKVRFLESVQA